MVGQKTRQWYRMSVAEALRELSVDPSIGVSSAANREPIKTTFIQNDVQNLFIYSVLRNRTHKKVSINRLVVGDIVALRAGDIVPADMRLLTAKSLTVLEDKITGSAAPSHKRTFASTSLLPKAEQKNMLFARSEVVSGIAVGLIVSAIPSLSVNSSQKQPQFLKKRGIIVQSIQSKQIIPLVDCVIFDDLQQEQEIHRLIQKVYLEKSITTVFFVRKEIADHIKKQLPEAVMQTATNKIILSGVKVFTDLSEAEKSKLLVAYKNQDKVVMYVHRGAERGLLPKIADVNFVISSTASQAALVHADLIAPKISISALASILHNNN